MKHLARVTLEPDVVREVDSAELLDLARQGLIEAYKHTDEAKAALGGSHIRTPGKWKAPSEKSDIVTAPPAITDPTPSKIERVGVSETQES